MNGDLDAPGWTVPGDAPAPDDPDLGPDPGPDLTRVTSRAEARALAEAAAQAEAYGVEHVASSGPATPTDPFTPARRPAAPRPPITPAPVPSPHPPASHVPGQWGAAAPTPPRPFTPAAAPPPAVEPPPLQARRSGLSVFGTVIRVLAMLSAVGYAGEGLVAIWASNAVVARGSASPDPLSALSPLRTLGAPAGPLLSLAVSLIVSATQVSLMVWLAVLSTDRRADRRRIKHGPVGTVLGFLLPIINVWWPYQSLRDAWRSTDLRPASKPTPMTIIAWWGLTIAASAAGGFVAGLNVGRLATGDAVGFQSGLLLAVGVMSLLLVGAQLCLSFAIGRVCFHLDAHDLLVAHHQRTHPSSLYRTA